MKCVCTKEITSFDPDACAVKDGVVGVDVPFVVY